MKTGGPTVSGTPPPAATLPHEALRPLPRRSVPVSASAPIGLACCHAGQPAHRRSVIRRLVRPVRVMLLLAAVWGLSAFDLGFTLQQAASSYFTEMNPVAAHLLRGPPLAVAIYKFGMLAVGSVILFWLRRHAVAELACWFLLAACFYMTVRWYVYYQGALDLGAGVQIETPL